MPLYLGLDAATHGLTAIVVEIEGSVRRVVFTRSLNFDRDLPHYGTTGGRRRMHDGESYASPLMWADALDRVLGRLAAAADVDVERIVGIAGCAHELDGDSIHQYLPDSKTLDPAAALALQLRSASPIATRFDSLASYLEALIGGRDNRLSAYWQRRFALPPAVIVPWTDEQAATAVGTGVVRDGVVAVSFGTNDTVTGCATDVAPRASRLSFRNGSLARELLRVEHRLDWDAIAGLLDASPGNGGRLMLPWVERETTPPIAHAGVRRFGFDRHDTAANMRALIEGQLMAMANHAPSISGGSIEKVIATGDAAAHRAVLQVLANVFGAEVYRLDTDHAAALGAALRAYHADRLAMGEPVTWRTVVSGFTDPKRGHRVSPNPRHVSMYVTLRKDYALLEYVHRDRRPIC
jgi:sugar (pentulose or hexulose) kinase